ncbi:hypothetical protein BGW80DRAFT_1374453 [Lactifluus volemus]|nr:hypothetical protein BGW80DRAFT_1374453 [Lactifluus volemus]
MMFLKTILVLSFAALALTAPTPQGGLGPDTDLLNDEVDIILGDILPGPWLVLLYIFNC